MMKSKAAAPLARGAMALLLGIGVATGATMSHAAAPATTAAASAAQAGSKGKPAAAAAPREFARTQLDKLSEIAASPESQRVERLREQGRVVFDYDRFAERSLGSRWQKLSAAERVRFRDIVRRLLESIYLRQHRAIFAKHKLAIDSESVKGDEAEVTGSVRQKDVDVIWRVKLHRVGSSWAAYDVVVDEMSILEDYRSQFVSFLRTGKLEDLETRLAARASENEAQIGAK